MYTYLPSLAGGCIIECGRMAMDLLALIVKTFPETLALTAFGFTAIVFLGPLAIYHVYLIAVNQVSLVTRVLIYLTTL